jgi:glucose-specific phosphotransferase system IIA component
MEIFSPIAGDIKDLTEVPDEVFATKMLGDGIAIDPKDNIIYAPFDGTIETLPDTRHAVGIKSGETEILIHIGVDTVSLQGTGFKTFINEGDKVTTGQKLIEFDADYIKKNSPSNLIIIILTEPSNTPLTLTKEKTVKPGDFLFSA